MSSESYDTDVVLWAADQSRALRDAARSGVNLPIDWGNVAEEIEALGKSQSRELASRIAVVLEHLLKLQASPALDPHSGWRATIQRQRDEIERVLTDSPSLRSAVPGVIEAEIGKARRVVALDLADHGETPRVEPDRLACTAQQVLGSWFPDRD